MSQMGRGLHAPSLERGPLWREQGAQATGFLFRVTLTHKEDLATCLSSPRERSGNPCLP